MPKLRKGETLEDCRKREREHSRKWRAENKDRFLETQRKYRAKNSKRLHDYHRKWRHSNLEVYNATQRKANKTEKYRAYRRALRKRKQETDLNFRIKQALRTRIIAAVTGLSKSQSTMKLIGCDCEFLRKYLEARFEDGMTWATWGHGEGKWQIDHTIPCAEFDLRDPNQQRQCFNYSNLKPMWWRQNIEKGAKRPKSHQAELL